jgi:hypothetical protein
MHPRSQLALALLAFICCLLVLHDALQRLSLDGALGVLGSHVQRHAAATRAANVVAR